MPEAGRLRLRPYKPFLLNLSANLVGDNEEGECHSPLQTLCPKPIVGANGIRPPWAGSS